MDDAAHVVVLGDKIGVEIFCKAERLIPEHGKLLRFLLARRLPDVRKRGPALCRQRAERLCQKLHFRLQLRFGHAIVARVHFRLGLLPALFVLCIIVPLDFHRRFLLSKKG